MAVAAAIGAIQDADAAAAIVLGNHRSKRIHCLTWMEKCLYPTRQSNGSTNRASDVPKLVVAAVEVSVSTTTEKNMSSTTSDTKLILTAVGAAVAGAALCYTAISYQQQKSKTKEEEEEEKRLRMMQMMRNSRPSFIMDDPTHDPSLKDGSVIFPFNHEEKMRRRIAARVAVEEDNMTPRRSVTVRVPATSANMGPGCEYFLKFMLLFVYCLVCI